MHWNKFFFYLFHQTNYLKILNFFNKKYIIHTEIYKKYKKIKIIAILTQNFYLFGSYTSGILTNILWYKFLPLIFISIETMTLRQILIENTVSKIPIFLFNSNLPLNNILSIQKQNPWLFLIPIKYTIEILLILLFLYINILNSIEKIIILNLFFHKYIYIKTIKIYNWFRLLKRNKLHLESNIFNTTFFYKKIKKYLVLYKTKNFKILKFLLINYIWIINKKNLYRIKRYFWFIYAFRSLISKKNKQIQLIWQSKKTVKFLFKKINFKKIYKISKINKLLENWLDAQYFL